MDSSRLSDYRVQPSSQRASVPNRTIIDIKQMQIQLMEYSEENFKLLSEDYVNQLINLAAIIDYKLKTL
ncbi:hypothetical protein pb186bvf_018715 [Paramecium bursaria]